MNKELINGFARSIHERAEQLLASEIWCNDTMLISKLQEMSFQGHSEFTAAFASENIINLWDESSETLEEFFSECSIFGDERFGDHSHADALAMARAFGFEPEAKDIYEYWRISSMLAERLLSIGEPILRNDYGCWWGRTCTGQAILMDGTLQRAVLKGGDIS